jgi:hypothetical protein
VVNGERYDATRIPIGVVAYVTRSAHLVFRPTQLGPCAPRSLCSADAQWPPEDVEAAAGREGSAAPGMSERGGACIYVSLCDMWIVERQPRCQTTGTQLTQKFTCARAC